MVAGVACRGSSALAQHDVVGLVAVQEPADEGGSLGLHLGGGRNGEEHTGLVPQSLLTGLLHRGNQQLQRVVASVCADGAEVVPGLVESSVAGDDGVCIVAQSSDLLVLVGVGGCTGVDEVLPQLEVIGQDLHIVKAKALVVLCEQRNAVLTHPVVQQVRINESRAAEAVLAGLFLHGLADGNEVVPSPAVLGSFHTGLFQHSGVVDEGHQRGGQRDTHHLAVDGAGICQSVVHVGDIQRAVRGKGGKVCQRAVLCVGGDVHIVHLDDIGHAAGSGVGSQLLKVAVPAGGGGLEVDVGVQLGVLVQHLLGQVVTGLAAPPGHADGHIAVSGRGAAGCSSGRSSGGAGSAAAGSKSTGHAGSTGDFQKASTRDLHKNFLHFSFVFL